ncbi:oxidoreductase [Burkholderia ubonensis]|uniref:Oxidoreductase n=2 Tax=Burkholderia ubonensis TaxID=101571 RepID=A0A103PYK7_9BURK|nr:oxidoreductase [Burkholderia ubonensis]KVT03771.1 oxidoreductase [Burkholderia ubonensis]KVT12577.1 oxidoreductase [Burkholderia ubonensis]KVT32371.1 oxidoreductase [Burkholderia ubonensis]KWA78488.1 oxidoreductase [Burkholderia ubonensis]
MMNALQMNAPRRIRLLTPAEHDDETRDATLTIANDDDLEPHAARIAQATRIDLQFPAFTDGRAYSQAYLLRKRFGFAGDLRATGEVLIDQLLLMERTGFSSAVLGADADPEDARRQLERFSGFYQKDVRSAAPNSRRNGSADE